MVCDSNLKTEIDLMFIELINTQNERALESFKKVIGCGCRCSKQPKFSLEQNMSTN